MLQRKFTLVFWTLCAFQFAAGHPTREVVTNSTKAALATASNAPYVNPDVELIDLSSSTQLDEDAYRKAAASNGMDPTIVAEVIRNRKPVVKTEFDANGAKRTTTYKLETDGSISRHTLTEYVPTVHRTSWVTSPTANTDSKIEQDWEWNPKNVPKISTPNTNTFDFPQYTPTWKTPVLSIENPLGNRAFVPTHPSQGGTATFELPEAWNTKHWPNTFEHVDHTNSGTQTKTVINDDGTKVTTTHTVGPTKWTTHTYSYPNISKLPKFNIQTTTPFPSLQDFLSSQYGTTTKHPFTNTIPNSLPSRTPVTTISVDDLPTVKVPINGLKNEDNVPQGLAPNIQTTKTYTKTIQTNGNPTAADLDPKMKEILSNAGISPEELFNSKNGSITKTRRDPDGRIVTTTYRVRTVPNDEAHGNFSPSSAKPSFSSTFNLDEPRGPFFIVDPTTPTQYPAANAPGTPPHSFVPNNVLKKDWNPPVLKAEPKFEEKPARAATPAKPIEEFLSKVNLTPATIESSNGEVIKTIVDDMGRVLTARFVLSTVKSNENYSQAKPDPIK